jgi:hypothetical protein
MFACLLALAGCDRASAAIAAEVAPDTPRAEPAADAGVAAAAPQVEPLPIAAGEAPSETGSLAPLELVEAHGVLTAMLAEWIDAQERCDVDRLVSLYAEDAVIERIYVSTTRGRMSEAVRRHSVATFAARLDLLCRRSYHKIKIDVIGAVAVRRESLIRVTLEFDQQWAGYGPDQDEPLYRDFGCKHLVFAYAGEGDEARWRIVEERSHAYRAVGTAAPAAGHDHAL